MREYSIVFHSKADDEFYEAFQWYEDRLEGLGNRFIDCIEAKLKLVTSNPLLFSKKMGDFREAKVDTFPYVIVFKIFNEKRVILISAIYHTSRTPQNKFRN